MSAQLGLMDCGQAAIAWHGVAGIDEVWSEENSFARLAAPAEVLCLAVSYWSGWQLQGVGGLHEGLVQPVQTKQEV